MTRGKESVARKGKVPTVDVKLEPPCDPYETQITATKRARKEHQYLEASPGAASESAFMINLSPMLRRATTAFNPYEQDASSKTAPV